MVGEHQHSKWLHADMPVHVNESWSRLRTTPVTSVCRIQQRSLARIDPQCHRLQYRPRTEHNRLRDNTASEDHRPSSDRSSLETAPRASLKLSLTLSPIYQLFVPRIVVSASVTLEPDIRCELRTGIAYEQLGNSLVPRVEVTVGLLANRYSEYC